MIMQEKVANMENLQNKDCNYAPRRNTFCMKFFNILIGRFQ